MILDYLDGTVLCLLDVISPHLCVLCGRQPAVNGLGLPRRPNGLRCWDRPCLCAECEAPWLEGESPTRRFDAQHDALLLAGGTASNGDLVRTVGAFKYHGLRGLAAPLGRLAWTGMQAAVRLGGDIDILVPLPLHGARERARGFNQARLLAEVLAILARRPLRGDILSRDRNTPQQAKISATECRARAANVASAFSAAPARGSSLRIGLVDDLITTGATVAAAARVLREAGWTVVWAVGAGITAKEPGAP